MFDDNADDDCDADEISVHQHLRLEEEEEEEYNTSHDDDDSDGGGDVAGEQIPDRLVPQRQPTQDDAVSRCPPDDDEVAVDATHNASSAASPTTTALLYSRADEKHDINAALEHLIVCGNYYRHQQWRMSEWERNEKQPHLPQKQHSSNTDSSGNLPSRESLIDDTSNEDDITSRRTRKRLKQSQSNDFEAAERNHQPRTKSDAAAVSSIDPPQPTVLHAQDARWYNPHTNRHDRMEPDMWPKPPYTMMKQAPLSDEVWEEDLSDVAIHPVVFSKLRLSEVQQEPSIHNDATAATSDPSSTMDDITISNDESMAVRIMLLQCWERAVHAAATTTTTIHVPSQSPPTHRVTPVPTTTTTNTAKAKATATKKRNREEARRICQQLQIQECQAQSHHPSSSPSSSNAFHPSTASPENPGIDQYQCSVCHLKFTTIELLQDHFYGKRNDNVDIEGCGWRSIDRKRQTITASIFENEIRKLSQQLVRHILFHPDALRHNNDLLQSNKNQRPTTAGMNGFDVLQMIQKDVLTSRKITSINRNNLTSPNTTSSTGQNNGSTIDEDIIFETLEVSMNESPLPINAAVIEAVRYRLVDRYGKIPR
jgi:hypothetical protein